MQSQTSTSPGHCRCLQCHAATTNGHCFTRAIPTVSLFCQCISSLAAHTETTNGRRALGHRCKWILNGQDTHGTACPYDAEGLKASKLHTAMLTTRHKQVCKVTNWVLTYLGVIEEGIGCHIHCSRPPLDNGGACAALGCICVIHSDVDMQPLLVGVQPVIYSTSILPAAAYTYKCRQRSMPFLHLRHFVKLHLMWSISQVTLLNIHICYMPHIAQCQIPDKHHM